MPPLRCPTKSVGTLISLSLLLLLSLYCKLGQTMRVNPERIAARLRIEQEIEMDKLLSRNRRQLGVTPKEISISVSVFDFFLAFFFYKLNYKR